MITNRMIYMKKRVLITAIIAMLFSNCVPKGQEMKLEDQIEKNLDISLYLYKSNVGYLGIDDLYIKRDDSRNAVYSNSKGVVAGAESHNLSKIQILKIKKNDKDMRIEYCDSIDFDTQDVYVVFSKDSIYVLDFFNRKFGKYFRTMMQYAERCK